MIGKDELFRPAEQSADEHRPDAEEPAAGARTDRESDHAAAGPAPAAGLRLGPTERGNIELVLCAALESKPADQARRSRRRNPTPWGRAIAGEHYRRHQRRRHARLADPRSC